MALSPKLICRFSAIPCFSLTNGQVDPEIHLEMQETQISENNIEKEEQRRKTHNSLFQNYFQN